MLFIVLFSISTLLRIYKVFNLNQKRQQEIEKENKINELNLLKAQLNPHFFFNSLNTIYALSRNESKKTPEAILNLSEIMRYMLRDNSNRKDEKVCLMDEINHIKNYLELQKLRLTPNNIISLKYDGNITSAKVFPLLFISFVENAFKYGIDTKGENKIDISFFVDDDYLLFKCKNKIYEKTNTLNSFQLGSPNALKRIDLLYKKKEVKMESIDGIYVVELKLYFNES
uniref:sensor histidine kinase n=2 Tax=Flavobacteriaceae TaxID=49546 RepID=UPI00404B571B